MNQWDTYKLEDAMFMFSSALAFNQNISSWNTSALTSMRNMFAGNSGVPMAFNQPIGAWDTSSVTRAENIFTFCNSFDQDLSNWNLNALAIFNNVQPILTQVNGGFGLSTANYNALLIAWDAYSYPNLPANSTFNFGSSQYSLVSPGNAVVNARNSLITKWGGISDGGGV